MYTGLRKGSGRSNSLQEIITILSRKYVDRCLQRRYRQIEEWTEVLPVHSNLGGF